MAAQTFWQWSDDIKPEDDITPFDGTYTVYKDVPYRRNLTVVLNVFLFLVYKSFSTHFVRNSEVNELSSPIR